MKLKRSILELLLVFSLLPVCIFCAFSIYETNQKIDEMTQCNLQAISHNQISNIQNFARDRKSEMEMVANYDLIKDAVQCNHEEQEDVTDRNYLESLLQEHKNYSTFVASISVIDKGFHVVASSEEYEINEISELKNVNEKFHKGNFIIGDAYERHTDDGLKKVVPAYIGIYENDELIGYISEELDVLYFDELRLNMDSLADGTFYLLDGRGTIITAGTTKQKDSLKTFVTNTEERSDFQKKWEAIDHEKNPSGEIRYQYGKYQYITYYANVENTNWTIRVSENLTAQKSNMRSYSLFIIIVFVLLVIGFVITQIFMTRKILRPVQSAMEVFQKIRKTQDYSLRIEVQSKDEMGQLVNGINELLAYIEEENIHEKATQRQLKDKAERDPLTGIKNKKAIEQYILEKLQISTEMNQPIILGFLDIDDFKDFNTNYGHQTGDEVIRFVAQNIQTYMKGETGRIGGDEFVFCSVGNEEEQGIVQCTETLLQVLNEGYKDPDTGKTLPVPCSIGIVVAKSQSLDYMELVRNADQAMYRAKDRGKNGYYLVKV